MQKRRVMFKSLYVTINLWHNITSAPLSTKNSYCTVILCNFHNLYSHFTFSWHEMLEGWPIELSFPSPGHHVRNAHGQRWLLQVGIVEPPSGSKFIIQACDVARTCENLDDKYLQRDCEHGHAVDCSKIHLLLVTSCYTFWPLNDNLPLTSVSSSHRSCPSFVLALTVFFFWASNLKKKRNNTQDWLWHATCRQLVPSAKQGSPCSHLHNFWLAHARSKCPYLAGSSDLEDDSGRETRCESPTTAKQMQSIGTKEQHSPPLRKQTNSEDAEKGSRKITRRLSGSSPHLRRVYIDIWNRANQQY